MKLPQRGIAIENRLRMSAKIGRRAGLLVRKRYQRAMVLLVLAVLPAAGCQSTSRPHGFDPKIMPPLEIMQKQALLDAPVRHKIPPEKGRIFNPDTPFLVVYRSDSGHILRLGQGGAIAADRAALVCFEKLDQARIQGRALKTLPNICNYADVRHFHDKR